MVSANTLYKNVLNVKNTVIENFNFYSDEDGVKHIRIKARPNKWHENDCPFCHKYITVIVNHDTNTVVWASEGHGESVLEKFYKQLTPEQLSSIKVVTGDDKQVKKDNPRGKGRPKKDDPELAIVKAAKAKADEIKGSAYALGKAPEHLSEKQQLRVNLIASQNPRLYRAYLLKEQLRLLLKLRNVDEAEDELKRWLWKARHSRIPAFKELYQKIRRHKTHILNTIRYGMSNARIEATNNKIKLIISKAYGFRNIQNMLDMVYLVCSDIRIPLPNRKLNAA